MNRVGVMHFVDTLAAGGSERVAVNLVNLLARDRFDVHLCTTRSDGPLDDLVASDVGRLRLRRRWMLDVMALGSLIAYINRHDIRLLHAHATSLFIATAASFAPPYPRVIWHDHFGVEQRPSYLYGPAARRAKAVISVSRRLADWARTKLGVPAERSWYIPNFVVSEVPAHLPALPGTPGNRIVCVANVRPPKDQMTLLQGMAVVLESAPTAHLLVVGEEVDPNYAVRVRDEARRLGIERSVSFLGGRRDVAGILRASDIGVLSSAFEGLPLALVEYAHAGLPIVATRVGECASVLADGDAGVLVPAADPKALGAALLSLLRDGERRAYLGNAVQAHVRRGFSAEAALATVHGIYEAVLPASKDLPAQAACL
jgi:glycosyltransferase involved in cell wall biosynthesis